MLDTVANFKKLHGMGDDKLNTHQKALRVNLDRRWYGSFAEIGAGQEVVRWFFRVGGASGTVAKSMSAYDMAVSDAIYGTADRYVSRSRLQAMLNHEFALNIERLSGSRGDSTSFFAFANTVATRNFAGTNECHGWLGVKFQAQPHDDPSQVIIHVRMLDTDAAAQQEALGIVGVNLCYGAFFLHHDRFGAAMAEALTNRRGFRALQRQRLAATCPATTPTRPRTAVIRLAHSNLSCIPKLKRRPPVFRRPLHSQKNRPRPRLSAAESLRDDPPRR